MIALRYRFGSVVAFLLCGAAGCSSAPRSTAGPRPDPGAVATLFDAGSVYGSMGLLVGGPSLPFVATLRYFADAVPDSPAGPKNLIGPDPLMSSSSSSVSFSS